MGQEGGLPPVGPGLSQRATKGRTGAGGQVRRTRGTLGKGRGWGVVEGRGFQKLGDTRRKGEGGRP